MKEKAFWLIVAILVVQLTVVLGSFAACLYAGFALAVDTSACRDGRIGDSLAAALAVALALYNTKDCK